MICVKCGNDKCDETHLLCENCSEVELPTELERKQIIKTLKKYQKKLSRNGESSFYTDYLLNHLQSNEGNNDRIIIYNILFAKEFIATCEIPMETDEEF
jgi:hypothetical protein